MVLLKDGKVYTDDGVHEIKIPPGHFLRSKPTEEPGKTTVEFIKYPTKEEMDKLHEELKKKDGLEPDERFMKLLLQREPKEEPAKNEPKGVKINVD